MQLQMNLPTTKPAELEVKSAKKWRPVRDYLAQVELTEDERILLMATHDLIMVEGYEKGGLGNVFSVDGPHCAIGAISAAGGAPAQDTSAFDIEGCSLGARLKRKLDTAVNSDKYDDVVDFNDKTNKKKLLQFFRDVGGF